MIKMTSSLTWNRDVLLLRAKKAMIGSVEELALTVEANAKLLCAVDKGIARASIHYVMKDHNGPNAGAKNTPIIKPPMEDNVALVGTVIEYGPDIEWGTGPHIIRAKNAKVLTDGKSFFGKEVNHPGTTAQPFMRPSIDFVKGKSLTIIQKNGKYYFKEYLK
jgi:hypothetical protein